MNTLNAATIARIKFVADCAHEDVALTTLKNAKDGIQNRSKIHAGYESAFAGVDMVLLNSLFADALKARTKAAFIIFIEAIQAAMVDATIELEKATTSGDAVEAAQSDRAFAAYWRKSDTMNLLKAAHEWAQMHDDALAINAEIDAAAAPVISEAEAMQAAFWGANDYVARRNLVNAAHGEALAEDKARRLAARTGFTVEQCHAELIAEEGNFLEARLNLLAIVVEAHAEALEEDQTRTAYRLWGAYLNEDFAGRRRMVEAAHGEALALNRVYNVMHSDFVDPARRNASTGSKPAAAEPAAPAPAAPAADIEAIDIKELHIPITAEEGLPYVQKVVTRAYVARSIARALASYATHQAKYTAKDRLWLAEHNADHAHRNSVITGEEYAEIYNLLRADDADPLTLIDTVRVALLTGAPVMPAVRAAAYQTAREVARQLNAPA